MEQILTELLCVNEPQLSGVNLQIFALCRASKFQIIIFQGRVVIFSSEPIYYKKKRPLRIFGSSVHLNNFIFIDVLPKNPHLD